MRRQIIQEIIEEAIELSATIPDEMLNMNNGFRIRPLTVDFFTLRENEILVGGVNSEGVVKFV